MAQPIWITPAGNLGTIPEGVFYSTPLQAIEPDLGQPVFYQLIAGALPAGIQIQQTGLLTGVPRAVVSLQGVPLEVSRDVTSKFAIRAYTTQTINGVTVISRLADRTFELTVTGQDAPEFITPAGQVAQYYDGSLVEGLQIQYTDTDPDDTVIVKLVAGQLPPGLTINSRGLISGFIAPNTPITQLPGYSRDGQGYDQYPYDFSAQSTSQNYEFILEVTDGKASDTRTFSIFVWSRSSLTADNTDITADNTFITADASPVRVPIILTPQGSIGTTRNDNFYAFQFQGIDLDGDRFEFVATTALPPGLTLDRNSGWLYGYIPALGINTDVYDFTLRVYKVDNPTIISDPFNYSLTITGPINGDITWLTDSDLGTIDNGATSTLFVKAVNIELELQYRLKSGSDSRLPQGLQLLPSGDIAGRVSFDTFALDGGATTFDVTKENGARPTTFDLKYTFTVNVYSVNGVVNQFKTFSITVVRAYNEPYDNLYIECMPPQEDRDLIDSLVQNSDIFQPDLIYRPQDPNFGVSQSVVYYHAFGLTASTLADYYSALYLNHYWKNLVLGNIQVAQATDSAGRVIYEVVYSKIIDDLVNNQGESVAKEVVLPFAINPGDSTEINTVFPNSLEDMRTQVIDVVGQVSNILPRWMISKQADGRVLGFTPAWVIAYLKPGQGERVAYYIRQQFGQQLNLIDFEVDRYELDRLLTKNWDPTGTYVSGNNADPINDITVGPGIWIPTPSTLTTFDYQAHYQLPEPNDSSFVFVGGFDYEVGDQIRILGSQVGGVNGANDIIVTVQQVDALGTIEQAQAVGLAPLLSTGNTYVNIAGTNISGVGYGATWDIEVVGPDPTVFDGNSLLFTAPVDMYSNTQAYDKYLVFPKRNILE